MYTVTRYVYIMYFSDKILITNWKISTGFYKRKESNRKMHLLRMFVHVPMSRVKS